MRPSTSEPRAWRKSSYSGREVECVEVADLPLRTAVRDSKHPRAGHLSFTAPEWSAFLATLKDHEV